MFPAIESYRDTDCNVTEKAPRPPTMELSRPRYLSRGPLLAHTRSTGQYMILQRHENSHQSKGRLLKTRSSGLLPHVAHKRDPSSNRTHAWALHQVDGFHVDDDLPGIRLFPIIRSCVFVEQTEGCSLEPVRTREGSLILVTQGGLDQPLENDRAPRKHLRARPGYT